MALVKSISNEQIFRQWVEEYSDLLYHYCLKRVADEDLSKDLVQEAFLAAWRNMEGYKGEASVKNWLFVIVKSKLTDHFRKSSHSAMVGQVLQDQNDDIFFDDGDHWRRGMYPKEWNVDFSNGLEVKEFYAVFRTCGKKMKEIQNNVFVMKYVDGLKSDEICKVLGITTSNYWVLIHRAKVQLRACLEKNWVSK